MAISTAIEKSIKIAAHCVVRNEEKWIWYSLMSVIDYVDEILVWDTGSTDKTVDIIKTLFSPKIRYKQINQVDAKSFTLAHQAMLEETKSDWVLIVDGDEIWPEEAISRTISAIKDGNSQVEYLVSKYLNLVGDVYHYQDPLASHYRIGNYYGNFTIRAVNLSLVPGIHFGNPYGSEGFFDSNNVPIQNRKPAKSILITRPYLHTSHLRRSSQDKLVMQRGRKYKHELGISLHSNFTYPKCFYLPKPQLVSSPWKKRNLIFTLNALWQTPLKYLYRRML